MGNAYDYASPRLIICNDNECHEAKGKELENIINMIVKELLEQLYLGSKH